MKMTGMMIVTAIETGFRIALRISRQAIANVALASRAMAGSDASRGRHRRRGDDVGAHAASFELATSSTYASSRLGSWTRSTLSGVRIRLIRDCAVSPS